MKGNAPFFILMFLIAIWFIFVRITYFPKAKNSQLTGVTRSKYDINKLKTLIPKKMMIGVFFCTLTLPLYSDMPLIMALILAILGGLFTYTQFKAMYGMGARFQENKVKKKK
ncbi:hypothetical protein [Bacillus sp. AFS053548]|uniref:hypothetical protein n=1 Tax=Bacillus sp. AFS053548 TaxID=2033505 RepID=UPI000BFE4689|nr:hypothetical protein [Bacillus sp. AFS053548]PGM50980.1 hypothetical protein CN946_20540 [Bacillus sp. AFS053548]